jgi:hypothetical protein
MFLDYEGERSGRIRPRTARPIGCACKTEVASPRGRLPGRKNAVKHIDVHALRSRCLLTFRFQSIQLFM